MSHAILLIMLAVKLEISRKNIVDYIIQIMPINQVFSLVTGVHSNPAELVARDVVFHICPDRFTHDGDGGFFRQEEEFTSCINFNTLTEKLACGEGRREGGREEESEGGRDGGMEGWRDGGWEGESEGEKDGWREGGRDGWRVGGRERWREREIEGGRERGVGKGGR